MNKSQEHAIYELLNDTFNPEGDIYILAISSVTSLEEPKESHDPVIHKVRIALTYLDSSDINPYFDGTDLFISLTQEGNQFVNEDEWADGPPIMEGSPIELALDWVSSLAPPFYISSEALAASQQISNKSENTKRSDN